MSYLFVNFGGPRHLDEIAPFLTALLTDRDVIQARGPDWLHDWLFRRIAKKRAKCIRVDYQMIGGKSPIYFDTESLAERFDALTFHRYLPMTHRESLRRIEELKTPTLRVIPLFPQFSYTTTGSIARFLKTHLSSHALHKLRWIRSYATHPAFIAAYARRIRSFLEERSIREQECALLFSAHGLPRSFIEAGDPYEQECQRSFAAFCRELPNATSRLSYQSKFGRGEWLRPFTNEACEQILTWCEGKRVALIVPLSFTSDHIETLYEIEHLYLPILRQKGLMGLRCPALNLESYWIDALAQIIASSPETTIDALIRAPKY